MTIPSLLDPLTATTDIASSYRRYLRTSFWLSDPGLRAEYEAALAGNIDLTRGPYLQAAAPYETGRSVADMIDEGVLHDLLRKLAPAALPPDRPLYVHQEESIRKLIGGRNLMIATGTGSGKTECYLLPILHQLLEEVETGSIREPGVRALLLYPMNALANDQIKRIRELFAPYPDVTFGRYVGDTPPRLVEAKASYRQRSGGTEPLANELIAREQMQESPPHVLLTNYAMLEYLLLRPADSAFFDGPTARFWRFLVLDEVHVYDGARGAELAMLLRRVKDRVHMSEHGRMRCVGTSATLGKGREDMPRLVSFAQAIFNERFEWCADDPLFQDVIEPQRLPLAGTQQHQLQPSSIRPLHDLWRAGAGVAELATVASPGESEPDDSVERWLDRLLRNERHVVALQEILESGAEELRAAALTVFGGLGHEADLVALVDLCLAAKPHAADAPLLPARYHFLMRALEGAFVCASPIHPAGVPRLTLARHERCQACSSQIMELGSCRKCGAAYFVGDIGPSCQFAQARSTSMKLDYLLLGDALGGDDDEDEAAVEDAGAEASTQLSSLCTSCGRIHEQQVLSCDCGGAAVAVSQAIPPDGGRDLRKCIACSGRTNTSIVYRFLTGADAPVAVIATALYQSLPASVAEDQRDLVGEGRKLLSFADSRQDAAFFAPYLERTYARAIERKLIWEVLRSAEEDSRFEDLVIPLQKAATKALVLDPDEGGVANKRSVRHWLMREILSVDRRQSLEGVGLAEVTVALPRAVALPEELGKLGFSRDEALDLARVLLDSLRASAAVWLPHDVDITDPIFSPRNITTRVREMGSDYGVLSWLPTRGENRRLDYLRRVLGRKGIETDARSLLLGLWRWFSNPQGPWSKVLTSVDGRDGVLFAVNPEWITFIPATAEHTAWRCDQCRQTWWRSVAHACPAYRCVGTLRPLEINELDGDHYRTLYTDLRPIGLSVEEHTGQLETRFAAELQERFVRGEINALSCSTTFELGVDVGEVQAVLMRNVPPSAANYVQRAGRAGRRAGAAALVVTFAQRRNHDLWFFRDPRQMVNGVVDPPLVNVDNEHIVRRHLHALAFAAWEREQVEAGHPPHGRVEDFFLPKEAASVERFVEWLGCRPAAVGAAILRVTPLPVADALRLADWGWVEDLFDQDTGRGRGWLSRAITEVRSELGELDAAYTAAVSEDRLKFAQAIGFVRKTLQQRRLIDFLAQRGVLPKYGFPVDVVSLDVSANGDRDAARVDLQRDLQLGITDFAPGNRIVANKVLWESAGLKVMPGKALVRKRWGVCLHCKRFRSRLHELEGDWPCPTCSSDLFHRTGTFVIPSFGFVGRRVEEKPGESRPAKAGISERYFDEYVGEPPAAEWRELGRSTLEIRYSRQARITVINTGNRSGFTFCTSCGYLSNDRPFAGKKKKQRDEGHPRPRAGGGTCTTFTSHVHLGHQYLTDAVEIRFETGVLPPGSEQSTLQAILASTIAVGISPNDVDGDIAPYSSEPASGLVLFDAVPGGAGHASHLADSLKPLFEAAYRIVAQCECGAESSCYACLRSYRNQRHHDELQRGLAARVLAEIVQG